ncbi:unnamed protein product [Lupinus luteus]|uniref:Uncharacterized protein n=1 Tax=Lupinus luteus TaxID=3873 RepID=A0AAV1VSP1_LUPLU
MLTQETTPSFDLISTVNVHMILNLWMLQFLFCCCHHFLKGGFTNISSAC